MLDVSEQKVEKYGYIYLLTKEETVSTTKAEMSLELEKERAILLELKRKNFKGTLQRKLFIYKTSTAAN